VIRKKTIAVTNRGTKIVALIILYKEREREREKKRLQNNLETKINTSNINIYIRTLISYFFFLLPPTPLNLAHFIPFKCKFESIKSHYWQLIFFFFELSNVFFIGIFLLMKV
jgi:hypothetical protein